jgi:hypothetical protein
VLHLERKVSLSCDQTDGVEFKLQSWAFGKLGHLGLHGGLSFELTQRHVRNELSSSYIALLRQVRIQLEDSHLQGIQRARNLDSMRSHKDEKSENKLLVSRHAFHPFSHFFD